MTAKFIVSGSNTTIDFAYTAPTTQITNILGNCAEYLFERGYGEHGTEEKPILFTSLTNQQKLNLIDVYLKQCVLDASNTFKSQKAQDVARATEEAAKFTLP